MKITISGWYGHFNAGDDAILQVFIEQAQARLPCEIVVLSELPHNIPPEPGVSSQFHLPLTLNFSAKAILDGSYWRHLRNLWNTDLFVLGGGGLLRDNTTWRNLFRLLDEIFICKLLGKKVMLYGIGVGPFKTRVGKSLIGMAVRLCDLITVRDANSSRLLQEVGVSAERIHVVADPAFLLQPETPPDAELRALLADGSMIGVFPTWHSFYGTGDMTQAKRIAATLDAITEQTGTRFLAVPMQVSHDGMDDVKFSYAIKAAMRHPDALVVYESRLSAAQLKWVTGQTKMNITVRLHAMIFSLGAQCPVVATNYEPKVAAVFSRLNQPEYLIELDADYESKHTAAVLHCLRERDAYSQAITAALPSYQQAAVVTFDLMSALMTEQRPSLAKVLPTK